MRSLYKIFNKIYSQQIKQLLKTTIYLNATLINHKDSEIIYEIKWKTNKNFRQHHHQYNTFKYLTKLVIIFKETEKFRDDVSFVKIDGVTVLLY